MLRPADLERVVVGGAGGAGGAPGHTAPQGHRQRAQGQEHTHTDYLAPYTPTFHTEMSGKNTGLIFHIFTSKARLQLQNTAKNVRLGKRFTPR